MLYSAVSVKKKHLPQSIDMFFGKKKSAAHHCEAPLRKNSMNKNEVSFFESDSASGVMLYVPLEPQ